MSRKLKEDVALLPDVGGREGRYTLVARGADFPDDWEPWLLSLADEYADLAAVASEMGLLIDAVGCDDRDSAREKFAESIGISFDREFFEGDHTSGFFVTAWIPTRSIEVFRRKGDALLHKTRSALLREARVALTEKFMGIDDLNDLRDALIGDASEDKRAIEVLQKTLADARSQVDRLLRNESEVWDAAEEYTRMSDDCVAFLCAVLSNIVARRMVGPFAWWDGQLFVLTHIGGIPIPESPYRFLLNQLVEAGVPFFKVKEETIIGRRPMSFSNVMLKGSSKASGWRNIWGMTTTGTRHFESADMTSSKVAYEIHLEAARLA